MKLKVGFLACAFAALVLWDVASPGTSSPLGTVARAEAGDTVVFYRLYSWSGIRGWGNSLDVRPSWSNPARRIHLASDSETATVQIEDCNSPGTMHVYFRRAALATVRGGQPTGNWVHYSANTDGSDPLETGDQFEFASGQTDEATCCVRDTSGIGTGPFVLTDPEDGNPGDCAADCDTEGSDCEHRYTVHSMTVTQRH
jgi:hypothetical protein